MSSPITKFKKNISLLKSGLIGLLLLFVFACQQHSEGLSAGIWRATLKTDSGVEIPFNFTVKDSAGVKALYVINAGEHLRVDSIRETKDSVFIKMPLFDSEIRASLSASSLSGYWIKYRGEKTSRMAFEATYGDSARFIVTPDTKATASISGRWSTVFVDEEGKDTTIAVGEFVQNGIKVTGSFLTTTGDFRFLDGVINGNKLFMSSFDGSHSSLFTATINKDMITDGKFYAGLSSVSTWRAKKDPKAMLPDAYTLTGLKPGYKTIDFKFPDLDGNMVSANDARFKNKVVVLQFLGSWCPNCMDETAFMVPFYERYKAKGFEVIGLAYERSAEPEKARKGVTELKNRFNISYPLLLTGYTPKDALTSMPALNNYKAFPTTIIIDRKGNVAKIHTGFNGPGTGVHYQEFVDEFTATIDSLLAK